MKKRVVRLGSRKLVDLLNEAIVHKPFGEPEQVFEAPENHRLTPVSPAPEYATPRGETCWGVMFADDLGTFLIRQGDEPVTFDTEEEAEEYAMTVQGKHSKRGSPGTAFPVELDRPEKLNQRL